MSTAPKEDAGRVALRGKPRPVKRLNRKTLMIALGTLGVLVLLAMMLSLRKPKQKEPGQAQDVQVAERVPKPEGLSELPKDYAAIPKVPQLGPPNGEFGRARVKAEREAAIEPLPESPSFRPDPEEEVLRTRRMQAHNEAQEAAKGQVFFQLKQKSPNVRAGSMAESESAGNEPASAAPAPVQTRDADADPNKQDRKQAFVHAKPDFSIYASASLQKPRSPYQLMAGTLIPAALLTGINSDLPGEITASVTENVYDTVTGQYLLVPQGTKLRGQYDSQVAYGQQRVLLVWTRLIRPDGSSIVLDRLPGVDGAGFSGLEDKVNWHWGRIFSGAAVSTLIGAGAELAAPQNTGSQGAVVIATRESIQDSINQVGQEITRRNLDIQPTLTVRPGFPVNVIVNKDLILDPFKG